ncbi:amidase [Kineosporia sp. NBRC 101677]|uniref:amidase n=1 Tax=Kineosporia sp. NBRC 101677 TaxID=3032197 RepID=UPI0024A2F7E1|nr:amidase [Kineosporia sp. NBRC 101677]GLY17616.1 amidase [Kineosporia sp. NBRC 101677]
MSTSGCSDFLDRPATELAALLHTGQVSAVEVLTAHLERIAAVNPTVNALVTLVPEQALAEAAAADARRQSGEPLGLLHGLPVAVKDVVDTAGIRTTYGSRIYAGHVPEQDALIVQRMRAAGAIVVGKSNVPEFGAGSHTFNEVFGATLNPYATDRSAGGSSGGAAAALACGMVALADGSDLGGSLRNPASFNNVVGLRPSAGRVPSPGPGNAWDPAGVLGPMGRSVGDAALLLSAIAGPDPHTPLSIDEPGSVFTAIGPRSLAGTRIAFNHTVGGLPFEPEVLAVAEATRERLVAAGAEVTDLEPDLSGADEVFETLRALSFLDGRTADVEAHADLVKATVKQDVSWGRELTPQQINRALSLRTELFRRLQDLLARFDVLIAPTVQLPPFPASIEYPSSVAGVSMERYYTWMRSCSRITATAMPVLAVPAGFTPQGLPVGMQIVGRHRGEQELLAFGLGWEREFADVFARRPVVLD